MRTARVTDQAVAVGAVVVSLFLGFASAEARAGTVIRDGMTVRDEFNTERKPLKYYVLQILGAGGEVSFEVVGDIDYRKRTKDYEEALKTGIEEWRKAKAEAKKRKEEFKQEVPKGPKLIQKLAQTFKKEEQARAYAEKMQKQWDEKLDKKQGKKEGVGKEEIAKKEDVKKE